MEVPFSVLSQLLISVVVLACAVLCSLWFRLRVSAMLLCMLCPLRFEYASVTYWVLSLITDFIRRFCSSTLVPGHHHSSTAFVYLQPCSSTSTIFRSSQSSDHQSPLVIPPSTMFMFGQRLPIDIVIHHRATRQLDLLLSPWRLGRCRKLVFSERELKFMFAM